jgi:hypothetical protein
MRIVVIAVLSVTALSAVTLLSPELAFATGGGPVSPPPVGTTHPAPPAVGAEAGMPLGTKPALDPTATVKTPAPGIDTSTAAPGGEAESSKNGALSTPADNDNTVKHHKKSKATARPDADTKS